ARRFAPSYGGNDMQDVEGKVAFITGGASGIGLGIAKAFVGAGMKVVLADLRPDHLKTALDWFAERQQGRSVHGIELDVTDRAAFAAAADEAERVFGKVHVVCNNAGVGLEGPLLEATYDDWDFGLGVNLGGVVNGVQTFVPRLRAHGEGGHIVNTASMAGLLATRPEMTIYGTTKAAVVALSEALRGGLAAEGIGVSVLCPGPIKSNIHEAAQNRPERFRGRSGFAKSEARLARRKVSDLWMEPEEVGEMVLRAIRNDELFILTHGHWRDAIAKRYDAIMAAMPETEEGLSAELVTSLRVPQDDD
ncbi:MAG TPA: SDR family NAD(P)-dependent oxidoreductase, partial [Hyphomicrobiales bacterium]|nr:SDR family NAD(P)-dependent oxidoreductase [Hyphomicrobiales bacterium]